MDGIIDLVGVETGRQKSLEILFFVTQMQKPLKI